MVQKILIAICLLISVSLYAQQDFQTEFQNGVALFQQKKFNEASEAFNNALKSQPGNFASLFNLALVQVELKNPALAIGLLRVALEIKPGHIGAKTALEKILKDNPVTELPRELPVWEQFRSIFLVEVSLDRYLMLLAIALASTLFFGIRNLHFRKQALLNDQDLPGYSFALMCLAVLTVIFSVLSVCKLYDQQIIRGTLITDKVPLRSAPDGESPALIELSAGIYVEILKQADNWVQISYPGSFSGWVERSTLLTVTKE